jgi:SagB-type dehydrogenase family enzyme
VKAFLDSQGKYVTIYALHPLYGSGDFIPGAVVRSINRSVVGLRWVLFKMRNMDHRLLTVAFLAFFLPAECFPAEPATVSLPRPNQAGSMSLEAALAARRSVRAYTEQSLTLAEVGQLLWAAQGVTSSDGKRTAPSAMHRYPLEIAVVAQNVDGVAGGAYRYVPAKHSLELLTTAKSGAPLLAGTSPQAQVHSAPAVFVITAVYERMGSGAKNRTWTDYEAGLASENLLLEAVALGLGAVVTGGIDASSVKEAVKLTGGEQVIVVVPVGHPAR